MQALTKRLFLAAASPQGAGHLTGGECFINMERMKLLGKEFKPGPVDYIMAIGAIVNLLVIIAIIIYYFRS